MDMPIHADITLHVNGEEHRLNVDTRASLLDVLREDLGLTGSKKGCDHGQCGACTVVLNGRRANACLALAVAHDGATVVTVEGLADDGQLSPVQQAFIDNDAFQCGYCTPGQLCSATAVLDEAARGWPSAVTADMASEPALDDTEIRERMSGNLCRCGAYVGIVAALREAAYEPNEAAADRARRRGGSRKERGHEALRVRACDDGRGRDGRASGRRLLPRRRHEPRGSDAARGGRALEARRRHPPALRPHRAKPGRDAPHRRRRHQQRPRRRPDGPRGVPDAGQGRPLGRVRPAPQPRDDRRQPAAAHRCPYFQDASKPCNKRSPGTGCPARDGEHTNLAILGHSDACVATHPSDMAVALMALGASVRVLGADGERTIPLDDFYRLPGDEPQRDTTLDHGDLITGVVAPLRMPTTYRKVRERASFAFALVSVAAALDVRGSTIQDVRLALGGVAPSRGGPGTPKTSCAAPQ